MAATLESVPDLTKGTETLDKLRVEKQTWLCLRYLRVTEVEREGVALFDPAPAPNIASKETGNDTRR